MIENPVLRGFHPDPSFIRVGEEYYLATSTFEWWPGVRLHRSTDLKHWQPAGHALTRMSQLDLRGVPDSAGVWAPSLSWADGRFWVIYSNIHFIGRGMPFKDTPNFLTTAPSIEGPWSDPVYLNSYGFDASLFHDDDGRKWLTQIRWDYRDGQPRFAGIILQEYDSVAQTMRGYPKTILTKSTLIEGPNLYKRDGRYYLMLAEGGTGYEHAMSMARADRIDGPYEVDPIGLFMTSRHDPAWPLQKTGHGELVETPDGDWWMAHLCSRPWGAERRCVTGRETALQRVAWSDDGWRRLAHGGTRAAVFVPEPGEAKAPAFDPDRPGAPSEAVNAFRDDFDAPRLADGWCSLRAPLDESWIDLTTTPGWITLRGRESAFSLHEQSMVAQRITGRPCRYETCMEFAPGDFTEMAGLVAWYDTRTHYCLHVRGDETRGRLLLMSLCDDGAYREDMTGALPVADWTRVYLRAEIDGEVLRFAASPDGGKWRIVGVDYDITKLSDDYGTPLHFTGAFMGLCVRDLAAPGPGPRSTISNALRP